MEDIHSVDIPVGVFQHFHTLTVAMLEFLRARYSVDEIDPYLRQFARHVHGPLIEKVREQGLSAMRKHLAKDFDTEKGEYHFVETDDALELHVARCPAVWYLKDHDEDVPEGFCLQTEVVLDEVCRQAGMTFSVDYNTQEGRCVQVFTKGQEVSQ